VIGEDNRGILAAVLILRLVTKFMPRSIALNGAICYQIYWDVVLDLVSRALPDKQPSEIPAVMLVRSSLDFEITPKATILDHFTSN
jgi:hypothetical protein